MQNIVNHILEANYNQIKRKNKSVTRLFPEFDDRVKKVGEMGGVHLVKITPDSWHFKVASGTEKGKTYDITYNFSDLEEVLQKTVQDKRLWNKTKTKINLNKLAAEVLNKVNIKLSCTCPAFKFWGPDFILSKSKYDAKYGDPENRAPDIRNPKQYGSLCKHLTAVFKVLPFYKSTMAKYLKDFYNDEIKELEDAAKVESDFFKQAGTALGKKKVAKAEEPIEKPVIKPEKPEIEPTKDEEPVEPVEKPKKEVPKLEPEEEFMVPVKKAEEEPEEEPEEPEEDPTINKDDVQKQEDMKRALQDIPEEDYEPEELETVANEEELLKKKQKEKEEANESLVMNKPVRDNSFQLLSYNSYGNVGILAANGKVYRYSDANPALIDKLKTYIKRKQYGDGWKILKKLDKVNV